MTIDPALGESNDQAGGDGQSGTVAYETHKKLLNEKKKLQESFVETQRKLKELEDEKSSKETAELEKNGEYKKLLDQANADRKSLEEKLTSVDKREKDRLKLASVLKSITGQVDGKFYGLIPYDEVIINPETGEVDEMSVSKVVEKVRNEYPEIIKTKGASNLPNTAPRGHETPGKIAESEWKKLPSIKMKAFKTDQIIWGS